MAITWVKSSHSSGTGGNCVEVAARADGGRAVRDSKDPEGPRLTFGRAAWEAFTASLKAGADG